MYQTIETKEALNKFNQKSNNLLYVTFTKKQDWHFTMALVEKLERKENFNLYFAPTLDKNLHVKLMVTSLKVNDIREIPENEMVGYLETTKAFFAEAKIATKFQIL
jgi:uncharacterized protein YpmS